MAVSRVGTKVEMMASLRVESRVGTKAEMRAL